MLAVQTYRIFHIAKINSQNTTRDIHKPHKRENFTCKVDSEVDSTSPIMIQLRQENIEQHCMRELSLHPTELEANLKVLPQIVSAHRSCLVYEMAMEVLYSVICHPDLERAVKFIGNLQLRSCYS